MELTAALRTRFPEADVRLIDTVCQPTKDRQRAMRLLAEESDVIVVVGGPQSNNSRKLAELARGLGRPARLVANASELRPEWFDDCEVVGLTAGTSTPDSVIQEARRWLEKLPTRGCQRLVGRRA
jgi:4-hydroxy-3-methylbut-2-en-1-yl diphosphate reductase